MREMLLAFDVLCGFAALKRSMAINSARGRASETAQAAQTLAQVAGRESEWLAPMVQQLQEIAARGESETAEVMVWLLWHMTPGIREHRREPMLDAEARQAYAPVLRQLGVSA